MLREFRLFRRRTHDNAPAGLRRMRARRILVWATGAWGALRGRGEVQSPPLRTALVGVGGAEHEGSIPAFGLRVVEPAAPLLWSHPAICQWHIFRRGLRLEP